MNSALNRTMATIWPGASGGARVYRTALARTGGAMVHPRGSEFAMLTAKQHELIRFIQQRLEETGISPSFEEMKEALDLRSKSGVHRLISALEERGFIRRLPNRARALEVIKVPEDAVSSPRSKMPAVRPANDAVVGRSAAPRTAPAPANDVIEIPVHYFAREGGESKHSDSFFKVAKTALMMLRAILRKRLSGPPR